MTTTKTASASAHEAWISAPAEIAKTVTFEAAHHLGGPGQPPEYARLHGHSFQVTAVVAGPLDPETGWVADLGALTRALTDVVGALDHSLLNEVEGLGRPTLERIAAWVAQRLSERMPGVARVEVARPSLGERCVVTAPAGQAEKA